MYRTNPARRGISSWLYIIDLIQSNVLFGTQLLEAMGVNNTRNIVNTGTFWQHYNNEDYNPVCLYAATTGYPLDMSLGEQLIDLVHIDDVIEVYNSGTTSSRRNSYKTRKLCCFIWTISSD
jgi:hypothetical protein